MLSLYATIKMDTMLYFYLNITIYYITRVLFYVKYSVKSVKSEDIAEKYITNMHACMQQSNVILKAVRRQNQRQSLSKRTASTHAR